ncbi:MAG: class I SAM-dependent methyltransferase [Thermoleophilia bacterium]|nr:class I SAM-dependent methyltransferase [Thermoleophilia bacterium]
MTPEETAREYDASAEATGWYGPEVAFGLVYEHLVPGQSVLDLGIGTARAAVLFRKAGLLVSGLDLSQEMLDASRTKGFDDLAQHDLTKPPYPYASESFDHVVCLGVLPFLDDLTPVFAETARMLKPRGTFSFMTLDRAPDEAPDFVVGREHTGTDECITMHRHGTGQIGAHAEATGLTLLRSLPFTAYQDPEKTRPMQARCFMAAKPSSGL